MCLSCIWPLLSSNVRTVCLLCRKARGNEIPHLTRVINVLVQRMLLLNCTKWDSWPSHWDYAIPEDSSRSWNVQDHIPTKPCAKRLLLLSSNTCLCLKISHDVFQSHLWVLCICATLFLYSPWWGASMLAINILTSQTAIACLLMFEQHLPSWLLTLLT